MTDPLTIPAGERGVIRLFALDMPPQQARFLNEPGAAAQMLGVADLDPAQIDIINIAELAGVGLGEYLTQGCSVAPGQIDQTALAAITGHVLLVRSRAFKGLAANLTPSPQLSLVATFTETPADWSAKPRQAASLKPRISPRVGRSQARRIGFSLFAVMMALIFALVLWVAK